MRVRAAGNVVVDTIAFVSTLHYFDIPIREETDGVETHVSDRSDSMSGISFRFNGYVNVPCGR